MDGDDATPGLLDILIHGLVVGAGNTNHARCPLGAHIVTALQSRIDSEGIDWQRLGRAALALLDARLTGASDVAIGYGDGRPTGLHFSAAQQGSVVGWLKTVPSTVVRQPSAVGVWIEGPAALAAVAADAPLVWWMERSEPDAFLCARHADPPFAAEDVAILMRALHELLAGLGVAQDLADVGTIDPAQRRDLDAWNATARIRRDRETVHGLFADVVARCPNHVAIVHTDERLAYAELDRRSNRVATGLVTRGIVAGDVVGVLMGRSIDALVVLLGILKAGAAYLPLDAAHPLERLAFAVNDARAPLVIGDATLSLPAPIVALAALESEGNGTASDAVGADGGSLAYVMYTSGSTGAPKGVEIAHRSIIRLVRDVDYVDLSGSPCILQAAPLGFDASTFEIWGAVLNGGTVVIHDEPVPSGAALAATIARYDVRIAWLTAALFNAVVDDDPLHLAGLRQLLIGGEALSVTHVRKALAALSDTTIINGYGPTECTTFAATYPIPRDLPASVRSIPIGRPIADTRLHVLNPRGQEVPLGIIGELHIGGRGVARGYLGRADLTAQRFQPDPFGAPGDILYRTGDRVRWLAEGVVEFIGRVDGQVKIRGFRIETGEIEAALNGVPGVISSAVIAREDQPGVKRLVAYFVAADATVAASDLRARLAVHLPDFMLPSTYLRLDALPVTANGKLDRRALPMPDSRRPDLAIPYQAPRGAAEQAWCALFAELLGLDRVGRDDNFFDLGGNSLLAVQAIASMRARGSRTTITAFFCLPNAAALAAETRVDTGIDPSRLAARTAGRGAGAIAIIAMSGRFPGAGDVETFWQNLRDGRESITRFGIDELDQSIPAALRDNPAYVRARGVIDGVEEFDAAFFGITPREAELMDPQQRLFLELCWECMERGGYVPDAHAAPVGVFGGMYNATYFQRHVSAHPDLVDKLGAFQVMLGNEKDYVTTRVAHKLNLTGPAISVHTACSTSLVAIAQAVQALRGGQCAMALAGGVAVTCPPASGYLFQEGAMLSPDGHTRSFSADAQGTVFSDGGAVVLLKRLDDALADGDPVHAVICGVAVNNDGGAKASFTAPSSEGQAAVVVMALEDAGVDAATISYIETHGTATPLGDPIEIEGLAKAFARDHVETGSCAIGSLKSNVGHLVIAAGAAGVIKTAFALRERELPPSLHAEAPNPAIDFARSPFRVNTQLAPWLPGATPRRAGVSAFGVGGTNAHVIVEEAPLRERSDGAEGAQLLLVSARTSASLGKAAARLADHLTSEPGSNLADVAYTLAVGRKHFPQRLGIVAADVAEAIVKLRSAAGRVARSAPADTMAPVFMFPGQGAQYAGMGRVLNAREPVFRAAIDECSEALAGELGFDLRERLFAADGDALRATGLTQPATFAVEYALACLWLHYGVEPVAMVGHSVGEFVAAAVAGVFRVADAARLVARRGLLMQAQPAGSMLSVRLDAEQLTARLPACLALAAENAPDACVIAGATEEVERFRAALETDGIACRLLQTSHAFHSPMMDAAVEPFRAEVERVERFAPRIRIVSTLSGEWLSATDALDAGYWSRHMRGTVRFSRALATLLAEPRHAFIEAGTRTTLSALVRRHAAGRKRIVIASLADSSEIEREAWLAAVGSAWCAGAQVRTRTLDARARKHRLTLPTYPFERKRHWVEAGPAATEAVTAPRPDLPADLGAAATTEIEMATPSPAPAATSREARLLAQLRTLFEDIAGEDFADADTDANFVELGLDSLTLTQVALQLQNSFGLKISFRQLMEGLSTFGHLARHIDVVSPADSPVSAAPLAIAATASPAAASGPIQAGSLADGSLVQQVIAQQMLIMQQQLTLLGGATSIATIRAEPMAAANAPTPADPALGAADEEASVAHTTYDVKKAFGAIARIHSTRTDLSDRQRMRLEAFMYRYIARTRASKAYTVEHRPHLADPRVVNGFRPLLKEIIYQIVVERSKGSRVWDIDGNEYIDALNGFGMNLFGWQPDFVVDAVRRQLDLGYEIGPQHPLAGAVARKVCELTGFDRAGLCNTGSEAVMGTIRIARTITGRSTLVIFTGAYHGIFDEVIVRGTRKLRAVPAAPGILRNTADNVLVLDYGTPETLAIIRERAHEIAAVLVEPVQSRRPDFQPRQFLADLRALTLESGALLIFDEVVTGFRCHPRGAQEVLGIDADLASYGKVVGGGFPIGVIAGKREYMDALDGGQWQYGDDSIPTVGVTYFAGTFVRHPLALAAAHAVLEHLRVAGPALQDDLNARTAAFVQELNAFCRSVGAPIEITYFSSVWKLNFTEDHPLQDLLFAMMRSRGIHILDNFPCFFTTAHGTAEFEAMLKAFRDAVLEMQEAEFLPRRRNYEEHTLDAARPPVAGARLGKQPDGSPAWFVPNPDSPGKYMMILT